MLSDTMLSAVDSEPSATTFQLLGIYPTTTLFLFQPRPSASRFPSQHISTGRSCAHAGCEWWFVSSRGPTVNMTKHIFGKLSEHIGELAKKKKGNGQQKCKLQTASGDNTQHCPCKYEKLHVNYAEASGYKHLVGAQKPAGNLCIEETKARAEGRGGNLRMEADNRTESLKINSVL